MLHYIPYHTTHHAIPYCTICHVPCHTIPYFLRLSAYIIVYKCEWTGLLISIVITFLKKYLKKEESNVGMLNRYSNYSMLSKNKICLQLSFQNFSHIEDFLWFIGYQQFTSFCCMRWSSCYTSENLCIGILY